MSSAYCPSVVAVSAAATASSAATFNSLFSFRSNFQVFYRSAPKSFKLVANFSNSLLLHHSNTRRHRFFCATEDAIPASPEEEEDGEGEEDADEKPTAQASGEEGRLYVGNLPYTITSSELSQTFGEAGNVVDVQVHILGAKVVYERNSGRSRGFGFVSFGSAEDVQSALNAMNGVEVEGRALRLNLASERATESSPSVAEGVTEESSLESSDVLSNVAAQA